MSMKRNLFLSAITGAALLLLTAACSNDDNTEPQQEPTQEVQFSFTNEDFGEDETPSRATSAAEAKPQTIDLGDCEAEITVESEPAVKKTRGAQTPATGHYTIRAYQGGVLKGEMSGTFSGGTFTPDASSRKSLKLTHGTYDFIAFNDDVIPSGNNLTVARDKAATAMIGTANAENINQEPGQQVTFTMKHVGARLRTQFVCQKHIPENITATLEATAANVIPASVAYNPATMAYTATNGAMAAISNNSPASTETKYSYSDYGQKFSYTSSSDYHYFLPTTEGSKLKLTGISAGTVFWKTVPPFNVPQLNATLQMQAGKSYVVKIKLKPIYTYLMSNGDVGTFKETTFGGGTKTPIAVVIDKGRNMAIALNDAGNGASMSWTSTYNTQRVNTHNVTNMRDALIWSQTSGLDETWKSSFSTWNVTGEKVKGKNPNFPAFKAAAEYNPGVAYTGSPALQWYLPSFSDFKWVFSTLGFGDANAVQETQDYNWYGMLAMLSFTQVGGTKPNNMYWTSSECGNTNVGIVVLDGGSIHWAEQMKLGTRAVRPFVKY